MLTSSFGPKDCLSNPKMLSAESDDLRVCRMIAGLKPKHHLGIDTLQVVKQGRFLRARPKDQHLPACGNRACDLLQKTRVVLDATVADGIGLVMEMRGGQVT